jgi:hypothetical protein
VDQKSFDFSKIRGIATLRKFGMNNALIEDLMTSVGQYSNKGTADYKVDVEDHPGTNELVIDIRIGNVRPWIRIHIPRSPNKAERALASLPGALDLTTWPTHIPAPDIEYLEWNDKSRSWRYGRQKYTGVFGYGPVDFVAQFWVGIAALWFLGKLADAYAARLADWMAETTVAALKRLRTTESDKSQFIVIKVPEGVTVMILPKAGLTDEAKEAFIDLDPNANEIRGKSLSWSPEAGAWLPQGEAISRLPPDA